VPVRKSATPPSGDFITCIRAARIIGQTTLIAL
jgi:hypothetical protein